MKIITITKYLTPLLPAITVDKFLMLEFFTFNLGKFHIYTTEIQRNLHSNA